MKYFLSKRIGLAGVVAFLFCFANSYSLNQITTFQHIANNQIQLIGTEPFRYQTFNLHSPPRLVIDINNGGWLHDIEKSDLYGTPVKDVRIGHHHGKLRLVLDLRQPLRANVFARQENGENQLEIVFAKTANNQDRPVFYSAFNAKQFLADRKRETKLKTPSNYPEVVNVPLPGRDSQVIVVIDPGHGGKDPGATGPRGIHEKNVVLKIANDLCRDINNQPGFVAKLTRTGDYYLTLRQRLAIARRDKADMFVAIHADAYPDRNAHGASVYALSKRGATSEAARWLAQRENESELMGGVDLNDKNNILKSVLISLSQTATIRSSLEVGQRIIGALGNMTSLHHQHVEQAAFVVLKSPDIPSLLVETGFISNPYEEQRLNSQWYQQKIASAVMQGVRSYFVHSPPQGTWLARQKFQDRVRFERYVVRNGDTLSNIAERFNVSVSQLLQQNQLRSKKIRVGQVLSIPASV